MKLIRKYLLCIFALFLSISTVKASHAGMMELTYRHINANTYEFTLVFYRNCLGSTASAPFSMNIRAYSSSLSISVPNAATLNQLPTFGPGVPKTQPPNLFNCSATQTCFEEYVYRGTINLNNLTTNPAANDWVFSYELCCFPGGAMLPDNIAGGAIRAECGLNNLDFPGGNDAPFWHERRPIRPGYTTDTTINYPGIAICEGVLNTIDQSVVEYEGDIIKYEFIQPITSGGAVSTYVNGFSLSTPMSFVSPPGLEIDSATGIFEVVGGSSSYNVFILGIKATEFRYDTIVVGGIFTPVLKKIGHVYRNFMVLLDPITLCPDKSIDLKKNKLKLSCADTTFDVETSKKFKCNTADFDGSLILLKEEVTSTVLPIDSVTVNSCFANFISKSIKVHLNSPLPSGKYNLVLKTGSDGNALISECGTEIPPLMDTIFITVDTIEISEVITSLDSNNQQLGYFNANCGSNTIGFKLTDPIRCNSVDTSGSEFQIIDSTTTPPSARTISSVVVEKCKKEYADSITIYLQIPFEEGKYELIVQNGIDGNTFLNECGEETLPASFPIIAPEINIELGPDLVYCKDSVFYAVIGPQSGFDSYDWSNGQKVPQIVVTTKGVYILEVDNGFGCKDRDTVIVTEIDCGTGIADNNWSKLNVFPNPADESIHITFEGDPVLLKIKLFNELGEEMVLNSEQLTKSNDDYLLDIRSIATGIYFLSITNNQGGTINKKIVVSH